MTSEKKMIITNAIYMYVTLNLSEMKANQEELKAGQEEIMAKMKACLAAAEAWPGKMQSTKRWKQKLRLAWKKMRPQSRRPMKKR
jgi:hypothetical protein